MIDIEQQKNVLLVILFIFSYYYYSYLFPYNSRFKASIMKKGKKLLDWYVNNVFMEIYEMLFRVAIFLRLKNISLIFFACVSNRYFLHEEAEVNWTFSLWMRTNFIISEG